MITVACSRPRQESTLKPLDWGGCKKHFNLRCLAKHRRLTEAARCDIGLLSNQVCMDRDPPQSRPEQEALLFKSLAAGGRQNQLSPKHAESETESCQTKREVKRTFLKPRGKQNTLCPNQEGTKHTLTSNQEGGQTEREAEHIFSLNREWSKTQTFV